MAVKGRKIYLNTLILIILLGTIYIISGVNRLNAENVAIIDAKDDKVIYLTFDDGPSDIVTNKILDILKEKNVKATFFIVGRKIHGREETMKRINNEGHSIGLHTYTHDYKKIYTSPKSFVDEMERTGEEVKRATGITANIIRFPGGTKPYLNKSLLNSLHQKNYRIFDWNAALTDGLNPKASTGKLVKESSKIIGNRSKVILLMHCDAANANTCKALPKIIDSYREKGYIFKSITNDTPEFYFRFQ